MNINGRTLGKNEKCTISAFVQQDDVLMETNTPSELFEFVCKIRLGLQGEELIQRVDDVINRLNLQVCKDTIVGGWLRKGISGGERKRTSIGYELISNPSLLLMDEPTSGLDSLTSLKLMQIMKSEANRGMAILCTIH